MTEPTIQINRAPVLTLWAATVAERLGFNHHEALSLGKAVAGLTAQSKGRRLGIYKPVPQELKKARAQKRGEEFSIDILGRAVPAINTPDGVRAVSKNQPIDAKSAERYLASKFGELLPAARAAMRDLAKSFSPEQLSQIAFSLYEKFRPAIPQASPAGAPKAIWISPASAPWPLRAAVCASPAEALVSVAISTALY
jgi:hypothetical protein